MTSHDFDVTMADSTFTFSNTMRMNVLGGEDVTPPSCAATVPIPEELVKAIKDERLTSSGTIATCTLSLMIFCHDPSALTIH